MKFSGTVLGITPVTNQANWQLAGTSSTVAAIQECGWSGEASSSTPMRTRITRDSAAGTSSGTGPVIRLDQTLTTPGNSVVFNANVYSVQPTAVAGSLIPGSNSWNAYGGNIRWLAAPGEEFILIGAAQIEARQDTGTGTSSYGVVWTEF